MGVNGDREVGGREEIRRGEAYETSTKKEKSMNKNKTRIQEGSYKNEV